MNSELISSVKNPKIKYLTDLQQKSSERRSSGLFVVEGWRELQHCVDAGYEIDTLFCCSSLLTGEVLPPCRTRFDVSEYV